MKINTTVYGAKTSIYVVYANYNKATVSTLAKEQIPRICSLAIRQRYNLFIVLLNEVECDTLKFILSVKL